MTDALASLLSFAAGVLVGRAVTNWRYESRDKLRIKLLMRRIDEAENKQHRGWP